ncbi:MAG: LemA family protein [Pseudomonadales bacterium]
MLALIVTLAIIIIVGAYAVTLYNGLVALKHAIARYLSNIDIVLKQRHDELPKLVETCKQYMEYEQETLESIITARSMVAQASSDGNIKALGEAETHLRAGLGQIFALAENYPELKADQSFHSLQQRISGLENSIADRREVYNEAVNNNNVRIEQFPDLIVAQLFAFKAHELLQFSDEDTRDVNISQLFN